MIWPEKDFAKSRQADILWKNTANTAVNGADLEDNTRVRVDMEFLFECSTYLVSHEWASEQVTCKVEGEKRDSISTSSHVLYCLLHKYTNDDFFEDFLTLSKIVRKPDKHFRTFPEDLPRLPKISEEVSIIKQRIWALWKGLCNHSNGELTFFTRK